MELAKRFGGKERKTRSFGGFGAEKSTCSPRRYACSPEDSQKGIFIKSNIHLEDLVNIYPRFTPFLKPAAELNKSKEDPLKKNTLPLLKIHHASYIFHPPYLRLGEPIERERF